MPSLGVVRKVCASPPLGMSDSTSTASPPTLRAKSARITVPVMTRTGSGGGSVGGTDVAVGGAAVGDGTGVGVGSAPHAATARIRADTRARTFSADPRIFNIPLLSIPYLLIGHVLIRSLLLVGILELSIVFLRHTILNISAAQKRGLVRGGLLGAGTAAAVDLEPMALRGEVKLGGLLAEDILDAATGEVDGLAAIGANQVVVVSGVADLIMKIAIVEEHPADEAQLDHQLHIPVDRGPAELGQLRAQLLGGEVVRPSRDCLDDRAAGLGHSVATVL